jgi:uncharacterized protein YjbJ (UPF0337 family)
MTIAEFEPSSSSATVPAHDRQTLLAGVVRRVSGAITMLIERVPGTIDATRAGTSALQTLPDPTLRTLAAVSAGLGAGLYLARAPRLVVAAGIAPALLLGVAIVLRPLEPTTTPSTATNRRPTEMTDEHTKGTISKAEGKIEETVGKVTGDKEEQAHGKAKQVQGDAQKVLGDVQDAVRGTKDKS